MEQQKPTTLPEGVSEYLSLGYELQVEKVQLFMAELDDIAANVAQALAQQEAPEILSPVAERIRSLLQNETLDADAKELLQKVLDGLAIARHEASEPGVVGNSASEILAIDREIERAIDTADTRSYQASLAKKIGARGNSSDRELLYTSLVERTIP